MQVVSPVCVPGGCKWGHWVIDDTCCFCSDTNFFAALFQEPKPLQCDVVPEITRHGRLAKTPMSELQLAQQLFDIEAE